MEKINWISWISLRIRWPVEENIQYLVKDCRHNVTGAAHYNGFDFEDIEWKKPQKGSLFLIDYQITHWAYSPNEIV